MGLCALGLSNIILSVGIALDYLGASKHTKKIPEKGKGCHANSIIIVAETELEGRENLVDVRLALTTHQNSARPESNIAAIFILVCQPAEKGRKGWVDQRRKALAERRRKERKNPEHALSSTGLRMGLEGQDFFQHHLLNETATTSNEDLGQTLSRTTPFDRAALFGLERFNQPRPQLWEGIFTQTTGEGSESLCRCRAHVRNRIKEYRLEIGKQYGKIRNEVTWVIDHCADISSDQGTVSLCSSRAISKTTVKDGNNEGKTRSIDRVEEFRLDERFQTIQCTSGGIYECLEKDWTDRSNLGVPDDLANFIQGLLGACLDLGVGIGKCFSELWHYLGKTRS